MTQPYISSEPWTACERTFVYSSSYWKACKSRLNFQWTVKLFLLASSATGPVICAQMDLHCSLSFELVLWCTGVLVKCLDVIELCRPWARFPQDQVGNRLVFGPNRVSCALQRTFYSDCCWDGWNQSIAVEVRVADSCRPVHAVYYTEQLRVNSRKACLAFLDFKAVYTAEKNRVRTRLKSGDTA